MTVALLILGHAGVLAIPGAAALRRAVWPERAPRLAIVVWQALSFSIVGSVVAAGLAVAVTATRAGEVARRCHATGVWTCAPQVGRWGIASAAAGGLVVLTVALRVGRRTVASHRAAVRTRRDQLDALAVVGRVHPRFGATVIDHSVPAAYCVPGRRGRVVVTTAALEALNDAQLAAVLAHERAHLRQRHHLILAPAHVLAEAFPFLPALRVARDQIVRLVEMAADDTAAKRTGRRTVVEALLRLAEADPGGEIPAVAGPAAALAAGGTTTGARARRLVAGPRPLGYARVLLGLATAAVVLAAPLTAAATALAAGGGGCCDAAPAASATAATATAERGACRPVCSHHP